MRKVFDYIKTHAPELFLAALLIAVAFCLFETSKISRRQLDLEIQFYQVQSSVGAQLSAIQDKVDFLADWAMQAPSVTLGDTYINQSDNSKSFVNSKSKGANNAK